MSNEPTTAAEPSARNFRWCGEGFSMVRQGFFDGAAEFFFSLSIIDLQKEEIKRNQKKSVSGYAEIICSNFANENRRQTESRIKFT